MTVGQFHLNERSTPTPAPHLKAEANRFGVARFVESFPIVAAADGGTKRLRELVLALAVRGALVPQREEEGDAASLILELDAARKKLRGSCMVREASPTIEPEEVPFTIPSSWRWARMSQLGGLLGGGTPSKANMSFWKGPIPWVSPKDMKRAYIDDAEDHISEAAVEGSAVKPIPKRSLLFVVRGMILAHSFPVALTTKRVTINQDMKALVLAVPETDEFLLRAFWAARARVLARVERSSHGTCRLESEHLEHLVVPVPPLAEQRRIVAKVDELMRLLDDLEISQMKKRETQGRLRTAALDALTSAAGPEEFEAAWKRVAENFGVLFERAESVGDLRATVLAAGLKGWLTARSRRMGTSPEGQPHGWWRGPLGELASFVTSGSRNWKDYYAPTGAVFVRSQDIKTDALDLSSPAFVTVPKKTEGTRTRIEKDDILITITGANVGKVAHVDRDVPEAYVSQHVALVRLRDASLGCWVQGWLASPSNGRGQLLSSSYGDKPGLNLSQVKAVVIDVPPPGEREVILEEIARKLKLCDDLEAKLRRAEDRAAKLVEAVLAAMVAA